MKNNPKETQLASKIGQALVKTHNYGKVHESACFIIISVPDLLQCLGVS